jgi:uncharacterized membrane protein YbhN (UPF0104 family)
VLNSLLVYISTEKWRNIDAAWRRPSDSVPSRATSYALTSVGLAIGMFLPVQVAMATARTLGTSAHGSALKRGTAGTLLEQGFDLLTVGFLAVASGITWLYHGAAMTWVLSAAATLALALLAVGPCIRVIRRVAAWCDASAALPRNRFLQNIWDLQHSGLLSPGVARRLVVLSALRFSALVLMSTQTAAAVGLHIPLWQMAAAIPLVIFATLIAITPGGLGVNEFTCAAALKAFGTPFSTGAQWAIANRILVAMSYFFVAACALIVLYVTQTIVPKLAGARSGK